MKTSLIFSITITKDAHAYQFHSSQVWKPVKCWQKLCVKQMTTLYRTHPRSAPGTVSLLTFYLAHSLFRSTVYDSVRCVTGPALGLWRCMCQLCPEVFLCNWCKKRATWKTAIEMESVCAFTTHWSNFGLFTQISAHQLNSAIITVLLVFATVCHFFILPCTRTFIMRIYYMFEWPVDQKSTQWNMKNVPV